MRRKIIDWRNRETGRRLMARALATRCGSKIDKRQVKGDNKRRETYLSDMT